MFLLCGDNRLEFGEAESLVKISTVVFEKIVKCLLAFVLFLAWHPFCAEVGVTILKEGHRLDCQEAIIQILVRLDKNRMIDERRFVSCNQ